MMRAATAFLLILFAAAPADAQTGAENSLGPIRNMLDCRSIREPALRLACFDRELAVVETAIRKKDVVLLDRAQVKRTQRSLFGFSIPNLKIFGDDSEESEKQIVSKIKQAWPHSYGKWAFELADGARWEQTDSRQLAFDPKAGQDIRIRRAALGSYFANVGRQTAIRVRRVR